MAALLMNATELAGAAEKWVQLEDGLGGGGCAVRLKGQEVDTMLVLSRDGQLILVAGRADWQASGSEEISLRVDSTEFPHLQVSAFNNLVLLTISNPTLLQHLVTAKDLQWILPSGKFRAKVNGMGQALELVRTCGKQKGLPLNK